MFLLLLHLKIMKKGQIIICVIVSKPKKIGSPSYRWWRFRVPYRCGGCNWHGLDNILWRILTCGYLRIGKQRGRFFIIQTLLSPNKTLWKVCESNHEATLETLKCKADLVGSIDWIGREGERERVINWIQIQCFNLSPKTVHMTRWVLLLCVSDKFKWQILCFDLFRI